MASLNADLKICFSLLLPLLFPLVHLYPVHAEFCGQLLGFIHRTDPFAAELVGEDDIEGIVDPRELIGLSVSAAVGGH